MASETKIDGSILDKIGDKFNGFIEGGLGFFTRLFGSKNERVVRAIGYSRPRGADVHTVTPGSILDQINKFEEAMKATPDLKTITAKLKEKLKTGSKLEEILPEAFAACREAARRSKNMRHYDVQMVGGVVLHRRGIAEMVTGEGKTLVATLPAYLNALGGKGVHVITVNDYLARRDCEWMLPIYQTLGVSAAYVQSDMDPERRRYAYECDITYGTNSEFGFDYLRDNMKPARFDDEQYDPYYRQVQRTPLNYAIIDEVDNILIDEARTPLIISGPAYTDVRNYERADEIVRKLTDLERKARLDLKSKGVTTGSGNEGDNLPIIEFTPDTTNPTKMQVVGEFVALLSGSGASRLAATPKSIRGIYFEIREKDRSATLTDLGVREAEKLAGVESFYTPGNMEWPHLLDNSIKAHHLYGLDRHYMIAPDPRENNELGIIIIDEFTGRAMFGRQWSDGLHQAVEAKHRREGVKIKQETQTLATVTLQNFFKLYKKLAGMSGTAMTEAGEFAKIYDLDVVAIPTNKAMKRVNQNDLVFKSESEKWDAIAAEVAEVNKSGRPILIGTTDVAKSEKLSQLLKRRGVKHELLNAKPENVAREAEIVAQAGRLNAVTISTNMAGRGTDIILGGNPETLAWAQLKNVKNSDGRPMYPTRLEVPEDVWKQTVDAIEAKEKMKEEGRKVADMGGLHIIGTERHESRRIDNQLRGRAGRQGDPGSSQFFLSLQDELMRLFGGERMAKLMNSPLIGLKDGEAISNGMLSSQIEKAQRKVEEYHFDQRKNLLDYDEVMDTQRKRTYSARQAVLDGGNPRAMILEMIDSQCKLAVERYTALDYAAGSFAQFAGSRLGIMLAAEDFKGCEFSEAEVIAKERAIDDAPNFIQEAIDENLGGDDERDWKWQELARIAESRFGFKASIQELKKLGKENIGEKLQEAATKTVMATDLSDGARFLELRYSLESLCDWARQQFGANVDVNSILGKDTSEIITEMQQQIRQQYRQKDLEFPIEAALATYLPEKVVPGRRPNREQLFGWTMHRFRNPQVSEELIRTEPRSIVKEKLMEAHKAFMPKLDYPEIDEKIDEVFSGATLSEAADATELAEWAKTTLGLELDAAKLTNVSPKLARDVLLNAYDVRYRAEMHSMERRLVLDELDSAWKSHLLAMDHLRSTVGMSTYAQEDPKIVYKKEGMKLFDAMWDGIHEKTTKLVFKMEDIGEEQVHSALWAGAMAVHQEAESAIRAKAAQVSQEQAAQVKAAAQAGSADAEPKKIETIRNVGSKVGRNDPCHCGSGKKYKNCHMKIEQRG